MARIRSPNYPALSLPAAVERARALHKAEARNATPREVIAKHLGFTSLNGASATILSALAKYGLIEPAADGEARISDLAMRILFPHDQNEKDEAIREAAFKPSLFAEIREKWPERAPSNEALQSYLTRNGFSQGALDQVIQFYRETLDMAPLTNAGQNGGTQYSSGDIMEPAAPQYPATVPLPLPTVHPTLDSGKPFTVAFDGVVLTGTMAIRSVRDIDRLMKVLSAQKAAFEAMQDEEE